MKVLVYRLNLPVNMFWNIYLYEYIYILYNWVIGVRGFYILDLWKIYSVWEPRGAVVCCTIDSRKKGTGGPNIAFLSQSHIFTWIFLDPQ